VHEPLFSNLPEQHDYRNPVVELSPKRLARWLNELPVMNLCACLDQVLEALRPCNLQAMPDKNRMRLLGLYRDTFVLLFDAVDDEQLARQPISSEQRQAARSQAAALCAELASGYTILVRECLRSDAPARQPLLIPALYRALEITAVGLLHSYRSYQPPPPFAYVQLHGLYAVAERTGIHQAPVTLERRSLAEDTIGAHYRQILMLAVSDPYRFGVGAAARLFPLLAPYAPMCLLGPYGSAEAEAGCYVIDRGADSAPTPADRADAGRPFEDPLLLDIRPALDGIAKALSTSEGDTEHASLLQSLLPGSETKRVRQAPRREVQREAWVTFGIAAVHHFLRGGPGPIAEAIRTAGAAFQVRDLDGDTDPEHEFEPWAVINESVSGYLLASRNQWLGEARVGDVVGVSLSNASGQPRLTAAAVRWMRAARDRRVEMGVEIIPGTARPVRCSGDNSELVAALFFPSAPALQLAATLVLPKGIYRPGAVVGVQTGERMLQVRAGDIVSATDCFDRFDFEAV